jgi:transcriptional regulator with XRE-family HTH domain
MTAETLGSRLRAARKAKGMSLRDVERATGINNAHLSQIENGVIANPEVAMLWALAAEYECDYSDFLGTTEQDAETTSTSAAQRRRLTAVMRAMGEMTPEEQGDVLNFMSEIRRRSGSRR